MNERIKKLRKTLGLTQQKFAEHLGMKQNTIATYEMGRATPSDPTIKSICREFNVSEKWLRGGEGDMFVQRSRTDELSSFVDRLLQSEPDDIRWRFVASISRLSTKELEILEQAVLHLTDELNTASRLSIAPEPDTSGQEHTKPDIAAELAELKRQNQELAAKVAAMEEEERDEQLKADFGAALSALQSGLAGNAKKAKK